MFINEFVDKLWNYLEEGVVIEWIRNIPKSITDPTYASSKPYITYIKLLKNIEQQKGSEKLNQNKP